MQRVRRDSASSTDSWSVIEQKSSREASSEELVDSDECGSDSEIEMAEEAYDPESEQDSDIEVECHSTPDEEENNTEEDEEELEDEEVVADSEEEEENALKVEESEEEEEDEEQEIAVDEDTPEWGLVSQKEAMSGEGKHFVVPEKIRSRLDSMAEKRHTSYNVALFLKISLGSFILQNLVLFGSLLLSKPIYRSPAAGRNYRPVTLFQSEAVSQPFQPLFYNNSASLQCWSPRVAPAMKKTIIRQSDTPKLAKWDNVSLEDSKKCWFNRPKLRKDSPKREPTRPKASTYEKTTISKPKPMPPVCKRKDRPPTLPRTMYPCKQVGPMPTPPKRKEPISPFSTLKTIMFNRSEKLKEIVPVPIQKIEIPLKGPLSRTAAKPSPKPKPKARNFNYKLEFTPAPKPKTLQRTPTLKKIQKSPKELMVISKEWQGISKAKQTPTLQKPEKPIVLEKKRFSAKASRLMRNSSYASQQCKREEFRQYKKFLLEDKTRRRRQRLVEYKVEKPCRAVYEEKIITKKVEKTIRKVDKLHAKIQKKIQKIEKKIQKRSQYPLSI